MTSRSRIDSQIAYYDARAAEYESSVNYKSGRFIDPNADAEALAWLQKIVRGLPFVATTLELGCGTGIWTRELLRTTRQLHALDSSSQMLELNRRACGDAVAYERANIFAWEPAQQFDRIVAGFVLSHVPDDLLEDFVDRLQRWNSIQGEVVLIDEAVPADGESSGSEAIRELADGTRHAIVKVCRSVGQIRESFERVKYVPTLEVRSGRLLGIVLTGMSISPREPGRE
jgi:trans-aconitate methyltransferase